MQAILQNLDWQKVGWALSMLLAAVIAAMIVNYLLFKVLRTLARRTTSISEESLLKHCHRPVRLIIIFFALRLVAELLALPNEALVFVKHVLSLLLIACLSWLIIKFTYLLEDFLIRQYQVDVKDNLQARKIHTQFRLLKRIVTVIVCILAVATMLMTFDKVRSFGTSILASAGIIGIVVGVAAQRSIATFIAGIQIALTQPIRIDDVVIVENEWGRIEEITLTYVVVRIWDSRRLILPITYFLEKPFQNWTRVSADLLGTVYLHVDYTVPIQEIRQELQRILKDAPQWDGRVAGLQATNSTDRAMELRALMSAPDASAAWDLRCHVREKLIQFIQENYPQSLPKLRTELHHSPETPKTS